MDHPRDALIGTATLVCALSVVWAALAGTTAIVAGVTAGSIALLGFGLDSLIDGLASAVLVWRFRVERVERGTGARVERLAGRVVGTIMVLVGAYVAVEAVSRLATSSGPSQTTAGVVITAASLAVLPVLAAVKLRIAPRIGSAALRGDGVLSAAGAALAASALAGLIVSDALGWWWADAVAALAVAAVLLVEGVRVLGSAP